MSASMTGVAKKDKQQAAAMKVKKLKLKKSKACIKKKTMELSVLCDIEACVVIVDGNGEVETWPENQSQVMKIIARYENSLHADAGDSKNQHDYDQVKVLLEEESVFDGDQNQSMALDLHSWDDQLINGLSLESLQEVLRGVDRKLEAVARRIEAINMGDNYINMGKEMAVFGEAPPQQIIEAPNFGWFHDGSSFCSNHVPVSSSMDVEVNYNQLMPSFGEHSGQAFFDMFSGGQTMQTPLFLAKESDQVLVNMAPGMYTPPQYTATGLPGQTIFGIWQNPTGWS